MPYQTPLTLLACAAMTAAAGGATIYATNNLAATPGESDELIVFDSSDPSSYTTIGTLGVDNIGFGGLDFDADGNLWAFASFFKNTGGAASGLYSVDIGTGLATPVGLSFQSLQDIAFNPVDGKLYGTNTQQASMTRLYEIDTDSGEVAFVMMFEGLPEQHHIMSFAIDSEGVFYIQDLLSDTIFVGDGASFEPLYELDIDCNFSQGMTIDWSRDGVGYHGAVGYGVFPDFFSTVNAFTLDGSSYAVGAPFGPNDDEGVPPVEPGDLAIMPAPPVVCPSDLNGDNVIDSSDLNIVLAGFGCVGASCPGDIDGNGVTDSTDLNMMLADFGDPCPE